MHPNMLKAMKAKKKRPIDPNAPPRPNLLSHEKVIKGAKSDIEYLQQENGILHRRLESIEARMYSQTAYLEQLHQTVSRLNQTVNKLTHRTE